MTDFNRFVDPVIQYDFERGPEVVRNLEDARQLGANCVALTHLVIDDLFGESLPDHLHAYEMFTDDTYFTYVQGTTELQAGDLLWFGLARPLTALKSFKPTFVGGELANWKDFVVKHVGVFTGETYEGDPMILHACLYAGRTAVWPLSRFEQHGRYAKLYGIRRFQDSAARVKNNEERSVRISALDYALI